MWFKKKAKPEETPKEFESDITPTGPVLDFPERPGKPGVPWLKPRLGKRYV